VVAGSSYDSTNSKYDFALLRYTKAGILDTGFGTAGIVTTSIVLAATMILPMLLASSLATRFSSGIFQQWRQL